MKRDFVRLSIQSINLITISLATHLNHTEKKLISASLLGALAFLRCGFGEAGLHPSGIPLYFK